MSGRFEWYTIPAGARKDRCVECGKPVYWVEIPDTPSSMPVDVLAVEGGVAPSRPFDAEADVDPVTWSGRGVSHFLVCTGTRPLSKDLADGAA